jgi:hypothetical protein
MTCIIIISVVFDLTDRVCEPYAGQPVQLACSGGLHAEEDQCVGIYWH